MGACCHVSKGLGDVFGLEEVTQQTNGDISQGSHDARGAWGPHLATLLIKRGVVNSMETVFDRPVASV